MFKRSLALMISASILVLSAMFCAAEGYDDNNTNSDNTITDTVNWLASDEYTIGEDFVTNVTAGINVGDFIKKFRNYENKVTVNAADTSIIKTVLVVSHSESQEKLTVVVSGDIDKNGLVNATDIVMLSGHITDTSSASKLTVDTAEFAAADYDSNGKATIVDLVNIKKYIMGE